MHLYHEIAHKHNRETASEMGEQCCELEKRENNVVNWRIYPSVSKRNSLAVATCSVVTICLFLNQYLKQ